MPKCRAAETVRGGNAMVAAQEEAPWIQEITMAELLTIQSPTRALTSTRQEAKMLMLVIGRTPGATLHRSSATSAIWQ